MKHEMITGAVGTAMTSAGWIANANDVIQIISSCLTIAGGILTFIVMPLISWYKKAKKDGKITKEEIEEVADIIKDGIDEIKGE